MAPPKGSLPKGYSALQIVRKFFPHVTEVKDAMHPITIEVTPEDAASKGVRDHIECAMAVACKRKLRLHGVIISRSTAYLIKNHIATRYTVPESATREIISFDRGGGFAPGVYQLMEPDSRLGESNPKPSNQPPTTKRPRSMRHVTTNVRSTLLEK